MYFHTDNQRDINWLAAVLDQAALQQRKVRIDVKDDGSLSLKVGESMWTPPMHGTPDPYRDTNSHPCERIPRTG